MLLTCIFEISLVDFSGRFIHLQLLILANTPEQQVKESKGSTNNNSIEHEDLIPNWKLKLISEPSYSLIILILHLFFFFVYLLLYNLFLLCWSIIDNTSANPIFFHTSSIFLLFSHIFPSLRRAWWTPLWLLCKNEANEKEYNEMNLFH